GLRNAPVQVGPRQRLTRAEEAAPEPTWHAFCLSQAGERAPDLPNERSLRLAHAFTSFARVTISFMSRAVSRPASFWTTTLPATCILNKWNCRFRASSGV